MKAIGRHHATVHAHKNGVVKQALAQTSRTTQLKPIKLACNQKDSKNRKLQTENQPDSPNCGPNSANIFPEETDSLSPTMGADDCFSKCDCVDDAGSELPPKTQHELEVDKDGASRNKVTIGVPNSSRPEDCACRPDTELVHELTANERNEECKGTGTCGAESPCECHEEQMDEKVVEPEGNDDAESELGREKEIDMNTPQLTEIASPGTADRIPEAEGEEPGAGNDANKIDAGRQLAVAALDVSIQDLEPQTAFVQGDTVTGGEARDQCSSPTGVTRHKFGDADGIGITAGGMHPVQHNDGREK